MFDYIVVLAGLALLVCGSYMAGYLHHKLRHPDFMDDIVAFHKKFCLEYSGPPRVLPHDLSEFRMGFMHEELTEYIDTETQLRGLLDQKIDPRPLIRKQGEVDELLELELDALIDLTYVVLGTAYLQFGPAVFREGWSRVQDANMAKVRKLADGQGNHADAGAGHKDSGRAPKYDVVKPFGWMPPSHIDLIQRRYDALALALRQQMPAD